MPEVYVTKVYNSFLNLQCKIYALLHKNIDKLCAKYFASYMTDDAIKSIVKYKKVYQILSLQYKSVSKCYMNDEHALRV